MRGAPGPLFHRRGKAASTASAGEEPQVGEADVSSEFPDLQELGSSILAVIGGDDEEGFTRCSLRLSSEEPEEASAVADTGM